MNEPSFLQSADWARFQQAVGHTVQTHDGIHFFETQLTGGRYLYAPHPSYGDEVPFVMAALEVGQRERAWFVRVEPNVGSVALTESATIQPTSSLQPAHTLEVPLRDDDTMLAAMHPKTRYNIRVAEKAGVTIRFSQSADDVAILLALLEQTSERASIRLHPASYYPAMLKTLGGSNPLVDALRVEIAIAEHDGKPIAGALIAWWNDRVIYLHGGSNYAERALMAPHLLHWTAMHRARDAGRSTYDMGGVAADDALNHPWAGISRFKRGFGGVTITYPQAVDIICNPFAYRTYALVRRLRRMVR